MFNLCPVCVRFVSDFSNSFKIYQVQWEPKWKPRSLKSHMSGPLSQAASVTNNHLSYPLKFSFSRFLKPPSPSSSSATSPLTLDSPVANHRFSHPLNSYLPSFLKPLAPQATRFMITGQKPGPLGGPWLPCKFRGAHESLCIYRAVFCCLFLFWCVFRAALDRDKDRDSDRDMQMRVSIAGNNIIYNSRNRCSHIFQVGPRCVANINI